ncbi:hypothetical protein [Rhodoblastus sp.]|uniref:hypothetical protein n=1 Tax=Rhodoblastus sp. TaxID=1962975 RepID=UPI002603EE83|nr:hypothetical protein [Rhodoblastus sp.]
MSLLLDKPPSMFALSLTGLWLIAFAGYFAQRVWRPLRREEQDEFKTVQGATLTLLGAIVGFTFAMSVSRYDQRKNLEESEAIPIGTELVRAQLLPPASRAALGKALRAYLDLRIAFYSGAEAMAKDEAQRQSDIWSIVRDAAAAQPTPIVALAAAGANDVINAQGYAAAA